MLDQQLNLKILKHSIYGLTRLLDSSLESSVPSHQRMASSVYSRGDTIRLDGSGHADFDIYRTNTRDTQCTDASPPVSPVHGPHVVTDDSPDVSPIDETPEPLGPFPGGIKPAGSSLPVQKDARHAGQYPDSFQSASQTKFRASSNPMVWDGFSGERITSETAKAAPAAPGKSQLPVKSAPHKTPFSILRFNRTGKKQRDMRRQPDIDDSAYAPPPREPWKGASGRDAIVNPIREKKGAKPFVQPPGSLNRTRTASVPVRVPIPVSDPKSSDDTIMPPVPPKDAARSVSAGSRMTQSTALQPRSGDNKLLLGHLHTTTPESSFASRFEQLDLEQEPQSRFSMTTYATTTAGTPPATPDTMKDVPPLPGNLEKVAARKPTPSEIPTDSSKSLPPSPEESQATSRIDALRAKQNDLARRRGNIDTMIHELTQVIQPSSIAYDLATRSEVKKTVESLNNELAEIRKEEHDIGMKLMRAYKKLDQEDYYGETSALWVRRAAS